MEKEKFNDAQKKIGKALLKKPEDIELNYSMAILYINRRYIGYNPEKSYDYIVKSKKTFEKVTDIKKLKSLNKIPINESIIKIEIDTITRNALEDAMFKNKIEVYDKYLNYYKLASPEYINKAIEKRDILAYTIACNLNTIESYQSFILQFPDAVQKPIAIQKRNALAFENVKSIDSIGNYKEFIRVYPEAEEVVEAQCRIHELAFAIAEKGNTSSSYEQFIKEYPNSLQYTTAFKLFEEKQFLEQVHNGDWVYYKLFIENYPDNSWKTVAQDSIYSIGVRTGDLSILKYCADNFTGIKRNDALMLYHDIYTNDGEKQTLDLFYADISDVLFPEIKFKDYELAALGDSLKMYLPYNTDDCDKYDAYIRLAAPREKAFVALQRIISHDISKKDWQSALDKIHTYSGFFGNRNKKFNNLITILEANWDNSIKVNSVGNTINTNGGEEYGPVISADDKLLYFCGKDRADNIGGEDIFVSKVNNGNYSSAKIVPDLSSAISHDAPLSVSADGTKIILFKSGKLFYSDKTGKSWSEPIEFPAMINSANWQSDAVISSDGKVLIYASTKEGGYNLYSKADVYHGDDQYNSDLYVSLLNENEEWSEPINLGNVINTQYCERMPYLHPDMKTLYFSSDGHGGLGKLDVFKTTRLADSCWDCWSEPVNMGKEINTEECDWGYKISTDGEKAYFAKKSGSKDQYDIFWLNIPKPLRPDLVATLSGKLLDKNKQPLSAEIRWEDLETGNNVGKSKSDPSDGSFFIILPLGKIYGYFVDKAEYFPISNYIDLRTNNKPLKIEENIDMISFFQMIEEGSAVPVNNLFFNFGDSTLLPYSFPELKRIAKIIKSNILKVEISGHTDNVGDDNQNQVLSEHRALSVKKFLLKEGCPEINIVVVGYGETKPVETNDTETGRAKNRRVELKFIK
jgi:outer membrane protein OmpA-like peptidoglycan-associated protein